MIRHKVLGQLVVILLISAMLFVGFYLFILQSYEDIEEEGLELNRRRVLNALDLEIERLDEVTRGWARNGLINFLVTGTPNAVPYRDMVVNSISGSFNIRELAIIDQDRQLIVARESDPADEDIDAPLPADSPFIVAIAQSSVPMHEDPSGFKRGLMLIDNTIHLISSHPNLDFTGTLGTSALIAAVHYNEAAVENLENIVEQEVELVPLSEFAADSRNQMILEELQGDARNAFFQPVNDSLIEIYTLLNDYAGEPAFVMKVSAARDFYGEASRTLIFSGIGGGFVFILLVGWFLFLLDKSVLRRLEHLSSLVGNVGGSGLRQRLPAESNDEIGAFGRAFNGMLDSLQNSQHALVHQATHDGLTGLINRHQFELELDAAIAAVRGAQHTHHLLFIDLDRFKIVNDSCGHMAGDKVLIEIAALMRAQLRSTDILGRIGGDEFGVILFDCDPLVARELAGNLREAVAGFRYQSGNRQFTFGACVGLVNLTSPDTPSRASALTVADAACRVAKNSGRNRVHEHSSEDQQLSRQLQQTTWVPRITEALDKNRFSLFYQRVNSLDPESHSSGVEVLLRLKGDDDTLIAPGAFLPAAERYRLMAQIDRWVLRQFFIWFGENQSALDGIDFFSLNLSGQSLGDTEFLDFISAEMKARNIPGNRLCFEITETSVIENLGHAHKFIRTLKTVGCRFALDDFGAGMSSFAYLRNLPVDILKINGEFCRSMSTSPIDKAMVKSINEIGHLMQLRTVAEFVETAASLEVCRELGIDYAQGFHLHLPQPIGALLSDA